MHFFVDLEEFLVGKHQLQDLIIEVNEVPIDRRILVDLVELDGIVCAGYLHEVPFNKFLHDLISSRS